MRPLFRDAPYMKRRFPSDAQLGLGLVGQGGEGGLVENREIGERLAVDFDIGLFEAIHEGAVFQSKLAGSRVDAGDPQGAELALPLAAVAEAYWPAFITACLAMR